MSSFSSCHQCSAAVHADATRCTACGADQSAASRAAHIAVQQVRRLADFWRAAAIAGLLAGLALGTAFGQWTSVRQPATASLPLGGSASMLTREQAIDLYLRSINDEFAKQQAPLGLVSWVPHPSGGIVLEMMPPTTDNPAVLWQALGPTERQQLMGVLAVSYTKALAAAGHLPNISTHGHPVLFLAYRGGTSVLASRTGDGKLAVFPSPYDAPSRAAATAP